MSQNRSDFGGTSTPGTTGSTGSSSSTGSTGTTGTESDRYPTGTSRTGTAGTGGTGTATAAGLAQTAQQYGEKITEKANQAKEIVRDKVAVVGEKLKDLQNADLGEVAENAKQYARQNPGQALLISAAAGFLLGLIIRGRR